MGKGRIPGPTTPPTLRMRPFVTATPKPRLTDLSGTFFQGSKHPLAFRVTRSKPLRVTVGTNDIDVTKDKDKPPPSKPLALPDEWAVAAGLADEHVPLSFTSLRHLPSGAKTYTFKKPQLTYDAATGIITGKAILSIPDSTYPASKIDPFEIPVTITIKIPRTVSEVKNVHADVQACKVACVDATVSIGYAKARLDKLVAKMTQVTQVAQDAKQGGANAPQMSQVVFDVEELIRDVVTQLGENLVRIEAAATAPGTWINAKLNPFTGLLDYDWLGINAIPKGPIFDFTVPGYGYRRNNILGHRVDLTTAVLAYPSLPGIFAGEHWTKMFPAYVYGEVSHARKVSKNLELGVRLTVAIDVWERLGLKPGPTAPHLFEPAPAGGVHAKYLSKQAAALQEIKDRTSPSRDMVPWVMFQFEGKFR